MNTTTTANARTVKTEAGNFISLPESFPSYAEREAIRSLILNDQSNATIQLVHTMEKIMQGSYQGDLFNAENIWCEAEAAFADHHGIKWQDVTKAYDLCENEDGSFQSNDLDNSADQGRGFNKIQIPTIEAIEIDFLASIIRNNPFRMVSRQAYNAAFSGACALRRAGVAWNVYSSRMLAAGHQKGYVAHLVTRAYTMPVNQLVTTYKA